MKIYLVIKHPEMPYGRGGHLAAGTVEAAFLSKKKAQKMVDLKNQRSTSAFWSVKGKAVDLTSD